MTVAFRRALAVLVVLFTALNVSWIAQYGNTPPALPGTKVRAMMVMGTANFGDTDVAPWWQIPGALTIGLLGLALAVVVYPRRRGRPAESWARGFNTGTVLHRPLAGRTD